MTKEKIKNVKNKVFFCLAFVCLQLSQASGQVDSSENRLLHQVANLRTDSLSGTGVFIQKNGDLYFVALAQLARLTDKNTVLTILGDHNLPLQFNILEFANPLKWVYHPLADVAVLKLNPKPFFVNKYLQGRFLSIAEVDTATRAVSKTSPLRIVGFPTGRLASERLPLVLQSFAISEMLTLDRPDVHTPQSVVVLQNLQVSSFTGGPVFQLGKTPGKRSRKTVETEKMVGFMLGVFREHTGKTVTMMTPAFYIHDLIK